MDVFKRISLNERIEFKHVDDAGRQRRALTSVTSWASECLCHGLLQAQAYEAKILRSLDGGATVDRLIAEIGTDIERAGKPSVAGLAGVIFAVALEDLATDAPGTGSVANFAARDGSLVKKP